MGAYLACCNSFFEILRDGDVSLDGIPITWDRTALIDPDGLRGRHLDREAEG